MIGAALFCLAYALFPLDQPLPCIFYVTPILALFLKGKKSGWVLMLLAGILLKGEKAGLEPKVEYPTVQGTLAASWTVGENGHRSLLSTRSLGTVPLYVNALEDGAPGPGDHISVRAHLVRFDPSPRGAWEGPLCGLQVKSSSQLERLGSGIFPRLAFAPLRLNEILYRRLEPHVRDHPELQSFLRALVFARSDAKDEEFFERFKLGGIMHILAISGLHVGIYLAYLLLVLRLLRLHPRTMAWIAVAFLLFYAGFCGFRAPVLRAAVMGVLHFTGLLLHRPQNSMHTLAFSLPLNALLMPHYAFTAGFWLSYLAAFVIILFSSGRISFMKSLVYGSIPTQLFLIPLLLYAFGTFTWGSVFLNPIVIPMASLLLLFFPFLVLAPCGLYVAIGDALSRLALSTVALFERTFWWGGYQPYPPGWLVLAFYAALIPLFLKNRSGAERRWRILGWGLGVFLVLCGFSFSGYRTRVVFLDVGQGSATLVEDSGMSVLVDTGKTSWAGRLLPQLLQEDVTELNALILTHPDWDHDRWAGRLLDEIPVGCLMVPAVFKDAFHPLLEKAGGRGVPVVYLRQGQTIRMRSAVLRVLAPGRESCSGENACSLVLLLSLNGRRILLPGDAENAGEEALIPEITLPLHVLLAAHHGSRTGTSDKFLACLAPRLAVISVGRSNPYGHPHPEVMDRLRQSGALIWRTDLRGARILE